MVKLHHDDGSSPFLLNNSLTIWLEVTGNHRSLPTVPLRDPSKHNNWRLKSIRKSSWLALRWAGSSGSAAQKPSYLLRNLVNCPVANTRNREASLINESPAVSTFFCCLPMPWAQHRNAQSPEPPRLTKFHLAYWAQNAFCGSMFLTSDFPFSSASVFLRGERSLASVGVGVGLWDESIWVGAMWPGGWVSTQRFLGVTSRSVGTGFLVLGRGEATVRWQVPSSFW